MPAPIFFPGSLPANCGNLSTVFHCIISVVLLFLFILLFIAHIFFLGLVCGSVHETETASERDTETSQRVRSRARGAQEGATAVAASCPARETGGNDATQSMGRSRFATPPAHVGPMLELSARGAPPGPGRWASGTEP